MTMLNSAPNAATAPATTGSSAGPAPRPAAVPGPQAHPADAAASGPRLPELHLLGSGPAPVADAAPVAHSQHAVVVPLDQFAKRGGPDAKVQTDNGLVNLHAVFQLDEKTHQVSVAIVNQDGRLIRLIPPESVSRMIAAMATYRGR